MKNSPWRYERNDNIGDECRRSEVITCGKYQVRLFFASSDEPRKKRSNPPPHLWFVGLSVRLSRGKFWPVSLFAYPSHREAKKQGAKLAKRYQRLTKAPRS